MPFRLPDPPARFAARGARLRRLAEGHAAADWLRFLALVAEGQRDAVLSVEVPRVRAVPGDGPPLRCDRVPRDASWREMLSVLLAGLRGRELPEEVLHVVDGLSRAGAARLEELAALQLTSSLPREESGEATLVGAALQAWFSVHASRLELAALHVGGSACPACGASPVAGVIDAATRRRYLTCSLCSLDWNVPRLTCASCGEDSELSYFQVNGDAGAKAEACGACRGYVKLFDQEKRPGAEAVADDAATLALDVLVEKQGFERIGSSQWLAIVG